MSDPQVPRIDGWTGVVRLPVGTEVLVSTTTEALQRGRVVDVEGDGLTLLNATDPSLPRQVRRAAERALARSAPALAGVLDGGALSVDNVRFSNDGVFVEGLRVVAIDQVLRRIGVGDVEQVRLQPRGSGGLWAAIALTSAGAVLGISAGRRGGPEPELGARAFAGALMIGVGTVITVVEARRRQETDAQRVVYRRP
jgi:hypothetical protein